MQAQTGRRYMHIYVLLDAKENFTLKYLSFSRRLSDVFGKIEKPQGPEIYA